MLLAFDCDLFIDTLAAADLLYKKEQNCLPNSVVQIKHVRKIPSCGASRYLRDGLLVLYSPRTFLDNNQTY